MTSFTCTFRVAVATSISNRLISLSSFRTNGEVPDDEKCYLFSPGTFNQSQQSRSVISFCLGVLSLQSNPTAYLFSPGTFNRGVVRSQQSQSSLKSMTKQGSYKVLGYSCFNSIIKISLSSGSGVGQVM